MILPIKRIELTTSMILTLRSLTEPDLHCYNFKSKIQSAETKTFFILRWCSLVARHAHNQGIFLHITRASN